MAKTNRKDVYKAIDGERDYQDEVWPRSEGLSITGEFVLLKKYMRDFETHYAEEGDDAEFDAPSVCLHDLRKIAAIVVRAMENNGFVHRYN